MSRVALVRCVDYEPVSVKAALEKALAMLGGIGAYVKSGNNVLLKPNLLSARTPDQGVTTRTELISALISLLKPLGVQISMGDSPAGQVDGIERVWKRTGLEELSFRESVPLIRFETAGIGYKDISLAEMPQVPVVLPVLQSDVLINLPKLKTHNTTLFTGAIKNCFGCLPGLVKAQMHRVFPKPSDFARLLVKVYDAVKPQLNIADGIIAMHGNGPATGPLFNMGVILVSTDGVALDAVASRLFGFDPMKIPTLRVAHELGVGSVMADEIELVGDVPPVITGLTLPSMALEDRVPRFILKLVGKVITLLPTINSKKCILCRRCFEACPMDAIVEKNGKLRVDHKKCINCLCCHELCEHSAVELTGSLPMRLYLWRRARRKKRSLNKKA